MLIAAVSVLTLATAAMIFARDERTVSTPKWPAFSEFRGFESWPVISMSQNHGKYAVILGNPVIIAAFRSGVPGNGKPFPDGSRIAKIHWDPKTQEAEPGKPVVPGALDNVDFMVKDGARFADSGGWGYAAFEYGVRSGTFRPDNLTDSPPQGNDAKCGFACHTIASSRDFVFTEYAKR